MKKQIKLILALCLLAILSIVALVACVNDENPSDKQITVTVNTNIDGFDSKSFTVDANAEFYSKLADYVPSVSGFTFDGWVDEDGDSVTAATRWESSGTVYAQWNADYVVEYYLETNDGFVKSNEYSAIKTGKLGATVVSDQIAIDGYTYDASNSLNVNAATLSKDTVLKMYYKRARVTITYLKNNDEATGEMGVQTALYGESVELKSNAFTWKKDDKSDFACWSTQPNGMGDVYGGAVEIVATDNITLYAQWWVNYTEQIYIEQLVEGSDQYDYVMIAELTKQGLLNNGMAVQTQLDEELYPNYVFNDELSNDVFFTVGLNEGDVLKVYYSIKRVTFTYADDNLQQFIRYNTQYTVRAPEDNINSEVVVVAYNSSMTGDGDEYNFGDVITATQDLMLYPVYAQVFVDAVGGSDKLVVRPYKNGLGTATLIVDGNGYEGYLSEDKETFTITTPNATLRGKLFDDGTFLYRNEEEVGTYLMIDVLFPDNDNSSVRLVLDGYGTGALSPLPADGSDSGENYIVSYAATDNGDYSMEYYLPSASAQKHQGYFKIVREQAEGADGHFMLRESAYGSATFASNSEYVLELDGYGNATLSHITEIDFEGEMQPYVVSFEGNYRAAASFDANAPEYVFVFADGAQSSFKFTLATQQTPNGESDLTFTITDGTLPE